MPSQVFGSVLQKLKSHLRSDARIVWATKGLEAEKGRLLHQVAQKIVGKTVPLAVISGPTFNLLKTVEDSVPWHFLMQRAPDLLQWHC